MIARAFGVLAGAAADRNVAEGAAVSPVTAAGFAEMTGLREVVVVVVTKLGVEGIAAWTGKRVGLRRGRKAHGMLWLGPTVVSVG